ncbi:unnamed protein product [Ambrosiozyma monospora]|uniref:Nucleolar protein 9 n=1 Tax=Ambrosiozyma monospora TaxID=43982 RepID=A0A9W6YWQ4_AMBMO|nr:unnamed protein product [Ambrosiozyma monospora]
MAKSRGRRAENQKNKEHKHKHKHDHKDEQQDEQQEELETAEVVTNINSFFGLVDSTELEYFKSAESTLNVNAFETTDERLNFINSVFEESRGKELKLVTNQICSKLMERLIQHANEQQIKQLFRAFNGNFIQLSNQKYSSHVMETFLIRTAALIEQEILRQNEGEMDEEDANDEEGYVSMENVFLFMLSELKPHLQSMVSHDYASHVLRVLLLVVAGRQLPSAIQSNSILRSKKSKIARKMIDIKDTEDYEKSYQVPKSFESELSSILKTIYHGQTTQSLRELAIKATASPVLQLLIQLEGLVDKERSFWCLTFNPANHEKDSKEGSFVEYLLSDPIGSHFFETALFTQKMKNVDRLYQFYMKDRILKLAKRETNGVFVVMMMMKKLKRPEQLYILDELVPHLNELIVNNLEIGSAIVDCSIANKNYKRDEIIAKYFEFFNKSLTTAKDVDEGEKKKEENEDKSQILENVLRLSTSTLGNTKDDWPTAEERRRSLFLEKLIEYDSQFTVACLEGLMNLPEERLIQMCKHGVFSHVVEACLVDVNKVDIMTRKRFLNVILPYIPDLACNAQASHIVDKLWTFTVKLNLYKDRIAGSLFDNKDQVKNSVYGKMVWKNWSMDMYSRKFPDWKRLIKQQSLDMFPPKEPTDSESAEKDGHGNKRKYQDNDKEKSSNDRYNKRQHHEDSASGNGKTNESASGNHTKKVKRGRKRN